MDIHSFWQMITSRHTGQYRWIVFLKIRDSLTCFSAVTALEYYWWISVKNYIRKSYSIVGTNKAFLKLAIWIKAQEQNGHFHAVLISNITGSTQNTPMKVLHFLPFSSFSKLDSHLRKRITSAQLFMPASIQY